MPAPKSIVYKDIEYRSIRSLIRNLGLSTSKVFRKMKNNEQDIDSILLAANKKKRKN